MTSSSEPSELRTKPWSHIEEIRIFTCQRELTGSWILDPRIAGHTGALLEGNEAWSEINLEIEFQVLSISAPRARQHSPQSKKAPPLLSLPVPFFFRFAVRDWFLHLLLFLSPHKTRLISRRNYRASEDDGLLVSTEWRMYIERRRLLVEV